jgi:hypothetical protein
LVIWQYAQTSTPNSRHILAEPAAIESLMGAAAIRLVPAHSRLLDVAVHERSNHLGYAGIFAACDPAPVIEPIHNDPWAVLNLKY